MNILLVDDHAVVREGYKALLNAMMPECTVLEAADGQQTHRLLKTHNINTLVLDINLAKESGLLLAADFLATQPNLKIIFFSMFRKRHFTLFIKFFKRYHLNNSDDVIYTFLIVLI
jgi:DNA-binding NarL/FixJ family response regulator